MFDTDVWTHLCVSYDAQTSRLSLYKDGRATNIDHIERNVADARFRQKKENSFHDNIFFIISFPPDFLDYVFLGRCLRPDPACSAPEGEFSDLNIWSKPLNREEMEGWTSCRLGKKYFFSR